MADIDLTQLRRIDFTLLLVFLSLLRHRKATKVAEELRLTQSTISHALKRLRDVLDDELFLRRPHGFEPTAVALALEVPVRKAIEELSGALTGPPVFAAEKFQGVVTIGAFDNQLMTLVPALIKEAGVHTPGMQIITRTTGRRDALSALIDRKLDLVLGYFTEVSDEFCVEDLYEDGFLIVGRTQELGESGGISLEAYVEANHIIVSPAGNLSGVVDEALANKGLRRTVKAAVPQFLPAFAAVVETGYLATVPKRLALAYAPAFGLVAIEPPLIVRNFSVSAVRHRRDIRNPLHEWLCTTLKAGIRPQVKG